MKYRTNSLKSILRKRFESREEFEDETTPHKRRILLFVKATCAIQRAMWSKNKFHLQRTLSCNQPLVFTV